MYAIRSYYELQRRAKRAAAGRIGPYLDAPMRAFVDALGRRKPRFYEGIEADERAGERSFASLRDLTLAAGWLERLEGQRRLFEERVITSYSIHYTKLYERLRDGRLESDERLEK